MTAYFLLAIAIFLVACAMLHSYRSMLICDFRARARMEIIDYNGLNFWESVQRFNTAGSFDEMHNKWSCWTYESFYGTRYNRYHFLGV